MGDLKSIKKKIVAGQVLHHQATREAENAQIW